MENKTLEFLKNHLLATVGFVAGGIGGAELSDLLTDAPSVIAGCSVAGQYAVGYPLFLALHAYDNSERYKQEGSWKSWKLAADTGRLVLSVGVAEIAYIVGRPFLTHHFLREGYSPTSASLISDAIAMPIYFGIAVPLARACGFIREDPTP